MSDDLDLMGVYSLLRAECEKAGGQAAFARNHGMSRQFVNDVLSGANPGPTILRALGLRAVTRYVRIKKQ